MTDDFVFAPPAVPSLPVQGGGLFPVRRIFCIGRNYADHVREMGGDPRSDPPLFFSKPADAIVSAGAPAPYPPGTDNLHFEGELVVALGSGGTRVTSPEAAASLIYGYACGCDLTRRDLQSEAKKIGGPWDAAKGFDHSAPVGVIMPAQQLPSGSIDAEQLSLTVNGVEKQAAPLASMIWSVPEIILALSELYTLRPGDLVFTGTPDGVGKLKRRDSVKVTIGPLPPLTFTVE